MHLLKPILCVLIALVLSYPINAKDPDDTIRDTVAIGNGIVSAEFSPALGRIVFFGPAKGKNLLWQNHGGVMDGWLNHGGDKIWPLRQKDWIPAFGSDWPPPQQMKGLPWSVTARESDRLELRSRPIRQLGIKVTRTLEIPPGTRSLVIKNRIERYAANPFPVQIWSITQVVPPRYCLLEIPAKPDGSAGEFVEFFARDSAWTLDDGKILQHILRVDGETAKSGTMGSWLAALFADGTILLQCVDVRPGGNYPDSASIEVYSCSAYNELETLSAQQQLAAGETMECTVIWSLLQSEAPDAPPEMQLPQIRSAVRELQKKLPAVQSEARSENSSSS